MEEIIKKALCEKIKQQEITIAELRKQIHEMEQCIKTEEEAYRQVCAERDEWRARALESEKE
jgi:hypothetical protein